MRSIILNHLMSHKPSHLTRSGVLGRLLRVFAHPNGIVLLGQEKDVMKIYSMNKQLEPDMVKEVPRATFSLAEVIYEGI